jgi:hypothetical protein
MIGKNYIFKYGHCRLEGWFVALQLAVQKWGTGMAFATFVVNFTLSTTLLPRLTYIPTKQF